MNILRSAVRGPAVRRKRDHRYAVAMLILLSAACGGATNDASGNATPAKIADNKECVPQPGKLADFVAVADFIKVTDPKPMRFLSAAGTDSSVSEDGFLAMQDKGPSYYYAGTEAQKKAIRDKLELAGPYTALLIVMRSNTKNADGTRTVRLGGHFVTGELNGKAAKSTTYRMSCGKNGWIVADRKDEGGA